MTRPGTGALAPPFLHKNGTVRLKGLCATCSEKAVRL
jgi:hypothetical protein